MVTYPIYLHILRVARAPIIIHMLAVIACSGFFVLHGCKSDAEEPCIPAPNTAAVKITITFEHFEDTLAQISTKPQLIDFLTRHPLIRDQILRRAEYPNDSVFVNMMFTRFSNPYIDTLLAEARKVFGDLSDLKSQFHEAFTNLKYYYPDFTPPKIQTVISGIDTDLLVSDSLIIVGLDCYLGKGAKYRPKLYEYLLRKYDPDDIVPSCILVYAINNRFNKTDSNDKTVLADMIAYGKSYYFAKHILPCTPDSVLISYTADEIKGSRRNEDLIWARFIESQVLFSTSHVTKKDYLGERPITTQVGEKCPGRIGQWIGWQIVKKYMETHPEITLPQLMNDENAQKIFKDSKYKPAKR